MAPTIIRGETLCPRCLAPVKLHPTTSRIPAHRERHDKTAEPCSFGGDYLPGFVSPHPIRERKRAG